MCRHDGGAAAIEYICGPACYSPELKALRHGLAVLRLLQAELHDVALKLFNPNQLRIPAGQPGGGRWTRDGAAGPTAPDDEPSDDIVLAAQREFPPDNRVVLEFEEGGPHGGHTIRDHVGKSDEYLIAEVEKTVDRLSIAPGVNVVFVRPEGSFADVRSANDLINMALQARNDKVDLVRSGQSERELIDHRFGYPTGREAYYSVEAGRVMIRPAYEVRMIIVPDQIVGQGFRVLTAFPINQTGGSVRK